MDEGVQAEKMKGEKRREIEDPSHLSLFINNGNFHTVQKN